MRGCVARQALETISVGSRGRGLLLVLLLLVLLLVLGRASLGPRGWGVGPLLEARSPVLGGSCRWQCRTSISELFQMRVARAVKFTSACSDHALQSVGMLPLRDLALMGVCKSIFFESRDGQLFRRTARLPWTALPAACTFTSRLRIART